MDFMFQIPADCVDGVVSGEGRVFAVVRSRDLRRPLTHQRKFLRWLHERLTHLEELLRVRLIGRNASERLLYSYLDPSQQRDYLNSRSFVVTSQLGHRYRVWAETVTRIESGGCQARAYCLVPSPDEHRLPTADIMLARAFWLSNNEEEFLRTAISRPIDPFLANYFGPPTHLSLELVALAKDWISRIERCFESFR